MINSFERASFCDQQLTMIERAIIRHQMVCFGWEKEVVCGLDDYNLLDALYGELGCEKAIESLNLAFSLMKEAGDE